MAGEIDVAAWLLTACGIAVIGIGTFFVLFRPPLLPEDRRYIAAPGAALDAVGAGLSRWLAKVFWVMGGYMIATGILVVHLARADFHAASTVAVVVAAVAGVASVGTMAVVNLMLRSDFRWPLLGLATLWTISIALAVLGV